jgi:hypothetical protein
LLSNALSNLNDFVCQRATEFHFALYVDRNEHSFRQAAIEILGKSVCRAARSRPKRARFSRPLWRYLDTLQLLGWRFQ